MNFIVAKDINTNSYLMCDSHGENKYVLSKEEYNNIKNKICTFNENKIALYNNNKLIRNSITILGKYYYSKDKIVKYLACDGALNKCSMSKSDIQTAYSSKLFSNIKISSDGKIRMLNGSIPFLNNLSKLRNTDTVIKISNISGITPGSIGVGKKFFGKRISDEKVGCVKFELFPNSYDIKNEVLAYKLGKILNFDVAEASFEKFENSKCIISIYNYNVNTKKIQSLKSEIGTENFHSKFNKNWFIEHKNIDAWNKFIQMVIFDLIMHQTDRHISNIAFKDKNLYSLYDNGRALFYDCFEQSKSEINLNNRGSIVESFYTNEHGYGWLYLEDILGYDNYKHLIRHDLAYNQFINIVNESYGSSDIERNKWTAEYMYKVYLIITRQERKLTK